MGSGRRTLQEMSREMEDVESTYEKKSQRLRELKNEEQQVINTMLYPPACPLRLSRQEVERSVELR